MNDEKPRPVILVGAGGQCKSMLPIVASQYLIDGVMVENRADLGRDFCGVPIKYADADLPDLIPDFNFIVAVGQTPINNPHGRRGVYQRLIEAGATVLTIQSRCAVVHGFLKQGAVIHDMAFVNLDAVIGENTIINSGAIIEHDVQVGNHCHVCPGAVVLGGLSLNDGVIVGAGSVVVHPLDKPGFYAGVPARQIALPGASPLIIPAAGIPPMGARN